MVKTPTRSRIIAVQFNPASENYGHGSFYQKILVYNRLRVLIIGREVEGLTEIDPRGRCRCRIASSSNRTRSRP
jgi:hypothetical protein